MKYFELFLVFAVHISQLTGGAHVGYIEDMFETEGLMPLRPTAIKRKQQIPQAVRHPLPVPAVAPIPPKPVIPQQANMFETEDLMPLRPTSIKRKRQTPPAVRRPLPAPVVAPIPPEPVIPKQTYRTQKREEVSNIFESESLIPFEHPLARHRRANPDDNVEGSGGVEASTTPGPATVLCNQLSCTGTDCLQAFNTTDVNSQCSTTGSCYIRATFNATYRSVEARCDTRSTCDWQMMTVDTWFEISTCCNKNFCNDLDQLKAGGSIVHHKTQYTLIITAVLSIIFVYTSFHSNL